mgnify:CR=1 FL=1
MDAIPSGLVDPQVGANHYWMSPFDAAASGDSIANNPTASTLTKNECEGMLSGDTTVLNNAMSEIESAGGL